MTQTTLAAAAVFITVLSCLLDSAKTKAAITSAPIAVAMATSMTAREMGRPQRTTSPGSRRVKGFAPPPMINEIDVALTNATRKTVDSKTICLLSLACFSFTH